MFSPGGGGGGDGGDPLGIRQQKNHFPQEFDNTLIQGRDRILD